MSNDPDLADYLQTIGEFPLLTPDAERELAGRAAAGDESARRDLILHNLRLVVAIAKNYAGRGDIAFFDLVNEGNYGLIRAVDHYRTGHNARFATYASHWVKCAITQALKRKNRPVRVPSHILRVVFAWQQASRKLEQDLSRTPTPEEIAEAVHLPAKRIPMVLKAIASLKSVSQDYADVENTAAPAVRAERNRKTHEVFDFDAADARKFSRILRVLNPREAIIIRRLYGLDGEEKMNLEDIGARLDPPRTRERVRQIEIEALRKILRVLQPAAQ